jgi:hypothetical protein
MFNMKKVTLFIAIVFVGSFLSCSKSEERSGDKEATGKAPVLVLLDSASYDFGTVNEGAVVEHDFRFKNSGAYPLILNNITSSCGCTTPEWPKEPIGPNESSSIKVRFDTKNKSGPQVKTITVYANTEPAYSELRLRGIINTVPKPEVKN